MGQDIRRNIEEVLERIGQSARRAGRKPEEINLVAVSKSVPVESIKIAYEYGLRAFGENYVQEALKKIPELPENISWHFIGRIQTNKIKHIVNRFALIQSVCRIEECEELQGRSEAKNVTTELLIEVNLSGEKSKGGVLIENTLSLIESVLRYKNLRLKGLMTVPPFSENPEDSRIYFRELRRLKEKLLKEGIPENCMEHLSMGMSSDFEIAIEEGATIVRIGTAIFGPRG